MTLPVELTDVSTPTLVMFGCAAAVTVPAVVATVALGTVPTTLAPDMFDKPAPDPINCPVVVMLPITSRYNRSSTTFRLEYNTLALKTSPINALALTSDADTPVNWLPLPIK